MLGASKSVLKFFLFKERIAQSEQPHWMTDVSILCGILLVYSEFYQASKTELYEKMVNGIQSLTIFAITPS